MRYKRFLIFGFTDDFPLGGLDDIVHTTDQYDEAVKWIKQQDPEITRHQVLDTMTLSVSHY